MMGRTHSVHAEPTTLGLKLAGWAFEVDRGRRRLAEARRRDRRPARSPGPSGRTATSARTSRRRCSPTLGLHVDPVSTQIVQRDRHAALLDGDRDPRRRRSSASRPRSATSSTPRSARSRSRSRPARRARRRCPTSATRSCPSGSPASPGCSAATPHTALEDQPLWHERDISHSSRRAGDPARRDDPPRLHARADDRPGRGPRRPARADAREHRARPRPARQSAASSSRSSSAAGCRARRPTRSSSARRCGPPTSGRPLRDLLAVDPVVAAQAVASTELDACFDDAGVPAPRPRRSSPGSTSRRGGRPTPDAAR